MRQSPSLYTLANTYSSQKRHSSNTTDKAATSAEEIIWQRFLADLKAPDNEFDANEAWAVYDALSTRGTLASLDPEKILLFAERLAMGAERLYDGTDELVALSEWARRSQQVLQDLRGRITSRSLFYFRLRNLELRLKAMAGDIEQAISLIHEMQRSLVIDYKGTASLLVGYESIIKSIWRRQGAVRAVEFVIHEWNSLGSHMISRSAKGHVKTVGHQSHLLREKVHSIVQSIADPALVLAEHREWSQDRRLRMGELFIEVLCIKNLPQDGVAVLEEMERQFLLVPTSLKLTLVRALARSNSFQLANSLYHALSSGKDQEIWGSRFKYFTSTGLYLFAHQGDVLRSKEKWDQLVEHDWVTGADIAMLLQVYAVLGKTSEVIRLFNEFFVEPTVNDTPLEHSTTIVHYTIVIFAHAQQGDFDGMNVWLERMSQAGFPPDEYVYNVILKSFAMRGEVDSLAAVLDQMRAANMRPSAISYTTAITLLAKRKDPVAAEALYKRALQDGVIPDRRMVIALMNAHVEAASWQGVIRAFDYLRSSPARNIHLSIEGYNTLLKAYVLIGAPFRIVSKLFNRLQEAKVRPDGYTFALLVQSACDAGLMDIASEIFQEMERLAKHWESHIHINIYVLTMLMAGFLRKGDKVRAKAVYDEMRTRNLQPTSATFHVILKAYANESSDESLRIAENFLKSVTDAEGRPWAKPTGRPSSALEDIFRPLMDVYARRDRPKDVERHLQGMLDAGGEASLGTLTALMYAYCRSGNIDAVLQLWPQIFQLALRYSRTGSLFDGQNKASDEDIESESRTERQANILCVPLSIYMDALSAAGMHLKIAAVWKKVKQHGFAFDSHNWNHLAIALVRAGEPERAFEVIEKVVLPYQKRSHDIIKERHQEPETPFAFEEPPEEDADPEPAFEGPSHTSERRAVAVKVATSKTKFGPLAEDDRPDDFAHSLHILHQISPSWSIWRPHGITLNLLARVLGSLESGIPIKPVQPDKGTHQIDETEEGEQRKARVNLAAEILGRIYTQSPNAVRAVQEQEWRSNRDWLKGTKRNTTHIALT